MLKINGLLRFTMAATLSAILSITAFADTIRLKDGSIIKGKITSFGGGKFTVAIGEGTRRREMTFTAADIESIVFDGESRIDQPVAVSTRPVSTNPAPAKNPRVVVSDNTPATVEPVAKVQKPEPEIVQEPDPAPVVIAPTQRASTAKPVEVSVKVLADSTSNGWTNSGWVVRKGQKIKITGSGEISIGNGKTSSASGLYDLEDESKLLKAVPTGALIAVIGDDNNEFIYIGSEREFIASRDGALFLGVNEGNLSDNTGSFDVKVEIAPDGE
jgi:hypothetical protein